MPSRTREWRRERAELLPMLRRLLRMSGRQLPETAEAPSRKARTESRRNKGSMSSAGTLGLAEKAQQIASMRAGRL